MKAILISLWLFSITLAASATFIDSAQRIWLARAAHGVMGTVWGTTQAVSGYFSLKRTNEDLVLENQQLREELDGLRADAHDLRVDSLGVAHGRVRGFDYIPAEVIKISRNKQHNYMILNKGFEDGIQVFKQIQC